jgi:diguanylate cyclase (GGDEF)-like protein
MTKRYAAWSAALLTGAAALLLLASCLLDEALLFAGCLAATLGPVWYALVRLTGATAAELRDELARNRHRAAHDALTGLPNRTLLFERVAGALAHGLRVRQRTGVLVLDLNGFKEVNDTLGHHQGDALLRAVADRLRGAMRESDTLARLGGDEFAVLLSDVADDHDTDGPVAAASRLEATLKAPFDLDGMSVAVGASIGVACAPQDGDTPERLLQCADVAMYAAKSAHSGVEQYRPELDTHSLQRLSLLGELRTALDEGQLALYFQPKADVDSRLVVGFEALVRWHHPSRGLVAPDAFIGLAERAGLMGALTSYVLDGAVRAAASWPGEQDVSVNVSVRNLQDDRFPLVVGQLLRTSGFPAERLVLEITESSLMADPERALAVLRRLKRLGVKLSIDDYGSGYSSLAYLQQLPVDELKIDRSFVRDITDHPRNLAIVRSTVQLGKELGLSVVAEGVEAAADWRALQVVECDVVQGYYLSRPLPEGRVAGWLDEYLDRLVTIPQPRGTAAGVPH